MTKEEILKNIADSLERAKNCRAIDSKGFSVNWYNPYYLVGVCFTKEELLSMTERELNNLIKLGDFASEVFY